ncbi:pimeloyl-CoA dehydrogenase small subunit [Mycobacterium intermedium]|uniref:Pimeloyl-CoA dehydrogenase small subunit n=1 Tax=Mycobacterium intermedium TaxID=28445 RepID=A0A1E3SAL2_MYCIE|nr:acyl-CoA dehydrogenase family protein [Mycobacterium intermedium]MCV6967517.1 acyl-CoA dehydrogenase family protein [Mycobacterium intermedium]ODQ99091.1 pimeloyl-CoA dehydrogenase small subunit [Mycobacterium intermedium]OPE49148.1 pimeloyl-CoA dehydrogenase small subunit [Mycobacterium intermedium]ORA97511.1 pimeloyl-CoA dehydrogenase small subunit [Mycobacterium intermedium]
MDFNLTNEQELLRDGLTKFLGVRYDLEKSRRAAKTGTGWQPDIWRGFATELGILGATLPEDVGGIGGGPIELMVITEALGHALVVEPYVETVVVAGGLLHRAGGAVATSLLEEIVAGNAIAALAATEPASADRWQDVSTRAERDGDGWVLNGRKLMAVAAPLAGHLLVTASTPDADGISLFLVDVGAAGIEMHSYRTIDDRRAADIAFNDVRLPAEALLGEQGQAWSSLSRARDEGAAAICSEAVGCMRKVLADTVEYCKQRQQFGQPIGRFQVLQHRMVDMYMELEQSVAAVYLAILNLDADEATRARAVSAGKATVGRAARFIGQQAVQLHGGMGMTEELAIGHYFKRLTAIQYEFGTTDHHIARYAELTKT